MTESITPLYDVEHAINMYADGFLVMPAKDIYDTEIVKNHSLIIERSHIYMIGYVPEFELLGMEQFGRRLDCKIRLGEVYITKSLDLTGSFNLRQDEGRYFIEDDNGQRLIPDLQQLVGNKNTFEVVYIGQSYGSDGKRNSLQRLREHETLQKIALKGTPPRRLAATYMFY